MYFKYDLKCGILHQWYYFLIPLCITIISLLSFEVYLISGADYLDRMPTFADVWLYIFKGEKPFNELYKYQFHFPILWILNQTALSLIVGSYPFSELYDNHGSIVLLKGRSRIKWITSKLLWVICACVLYYLVMLTAIILFCLLTNIPLNLTIYPSISSFYVTSEQVISGIPILILLFLPFITSIALSFLQTAVSLLLGTISGFGTILVVCGLSIFTEHVAAFGNCSLLIRNEVFGYSDIQTRTSIIVLFCVIAITGIFCIISFRNYDVLCNRREN